MALFEWQWQYEGKKVAITGELLKMMAIEF